MESIQPELYNYASLLFSLVALVYARYAVSGFKQLIARQPKRYVVSRPTATFGTINECKGHVE